MKVNTELYMIIVDLFKENSFEDFCDDYNCWDCPLRSVELKQCSTSFKKIKEELDSVKRYKEILRDCISRDLYNYEDITIRYREKYIDPLLKERGKSIEGFNEDLISEKEVFHKEMLRYLEMCGGDY